MGCVPRLPSIGRMEKVTITLKLRDETERLRL